MTLIFQCVSQEIKLRTMLSLNIMQMKHLWATLRIILTVSQMLSEYDEISRSLKQLCRYISMISFTQISLFSSIFWTTIWMLSWLTLRHLNFQNMKCWDLRVQVTSYWEILICLTMLSQISSCWASHSINLTLKKLHIMTSIIMRLWISTLKKSFQVFLKFFAVTLFWGAERWSLHLQKMFSHSITNCFRDVISIIEEESNVYILLYWRVYQQLW